MKRFGKSNDPNSNPFDNITDDEFKVMLEEGFESGKLDCYADLRGDICYRMTFTSSNDWIVNCYITELGIAVDHDYDCGGNSSNQTWWFDDGEYTQEEFNYKTFDYDEVTHQKFANTFKEAWDKMVDYSKSL